MLIQRSLRLGLVLFVFVLGCATVPETDKVETEEHVPEQESEVPVPAKPNLKTYKPGPVPETNAELEVSLGMKRDETDLGFAEKQFDPCQMGAAGSTGCGAHYFAVVHFQLFCRDSEGTVGDVPSTEPIASDSVSWQLGGTAGTAPTDARGYGHFSIVSQTPTRGQRLILRIGPQFIGLPVSDVTKVVLPKNYCHHDS